MAQLKVGDHIPSIQLRDQNNKVVNVDELIGTSNLVIYFYPKDDTPGCTKEACGFRDQFEVFKEAGATVIGISSDSPESHLTFAKKYNLPFTLLSDEENVVRKAFGVEGNLFGLIPGRVTFVIDKKGVIQHVFDSQMKAEKHIKESLDALEKLN